MGTLTGSPGPPAMGSGVDDRAPSLREGSAPTPDANVISAQERHLRLEKVGKRFGRQRALIDLSLSFAPGRVAAVLGPNGAGKTTLLGILSTLVAPTSGTLTFGAERLTRESALRATIGFVGHEPGLYVDLTALENLELFVALYGLSDARA